MSDVTQKLKIQIDNIMQFLNLHTNADDTSGCFNYNGRVFRVKISLNPFAEVVNMQVTAVDTMKAEAVYESYEQNPISVERLQEVENILVQYITLQENGSISTSTLQ